MRWAGKKAVLLKSMCDIGITLKVLQLAKFYSPVPGGMETVTFDLTEGLVGRGVSVDVLCANTVAKSSREEFPAGYTVIRSASLGKAFSMSLAPRLIMDLARHIRDYDIVHVHLPNPLANLALWLSRPKCKVVLHWHSDIIKQKHLLRLYEPLQQWLLKRADVIIATSPPYVDSSSWLSRYQSKVKVVPIGIDEGQMHVEDVFLSKLRLKYAGKKIVFSLGRLTYYKGFSSLLHAAALLPDDVVVLIGGNGELHDGLQAEIDALGLSGRVQLVGKISADHLGAYYCLSDVFCLPSIARSEAFGVVLLEAMQHGKPIVATNIPGSGVPWVNIHGETGLNVEPNNPATLADALLEILNNIELATRCGNFSRDRYKKFFTADVMVGKILGIYSSLVSPMHARR